MPAGLDSVGLSSSVPAAQKHAQTTSVSAHSTGVSWTHAARALLRPDEILHDMSKTIGASDLSAGLPTFLLLASLCTVSIPPDTSGSD